MELVREAKDLIIGEFYWFSSIKFIPDVPEGKLPEFKNIALCSDHHGHKYISENRIWAEEENDQFTGQYVAFGPIPKPEIKPAPGKPYAVFCNGKPASTKGFKTLARGLGWDNHIFPTKREAEIYAYKWAYPVTDWADLENVPAMELNKRYDYSMGDDPVWMEIKQLP